MKVLVVDDDRALREVLRRALTVAGYEVALAETGGTALTRVSGEEPDAVVLDIGLPDIDGRDVCRQIRSGSDVPIIMVTASGSVTDRIVGLELGADDYVVKPFATHEVIARIRAVMRRGRRNDAAGRGPLTVQDLRIDGGSRRVWQDGAELDLTRKEFDLLLRLAQDAGRVVSREDLMSDVWDANWFGSTKTLDVHIGWLRRKLGDDPDAPAYIRTVRGVGFELVIGKED
jgi:DNA-binding response OmpR family regulator